MSTHYTKQLLLDYGLTEKDYIEIVATAAENAWAGYDKITGETGPTQIAEAVAHDLGHAEWLDDETHPVWDIAAEVAEAADEEVI